MAMMFNSDPDLHRKFEIIELEVRHEFKEELDEAGFFKQPFVEYKIRKEIKKRQNKIRSDYSV